MEKHKAIVFGERRRVIYSAYYSGTIHKDSELVENKSIFEGEIENPPLEINEYIFIKEINKSVQIKKIARNIEGGYVYYSNHVIEVIEDDKTVKSREEAEEESKRNIERRRIEAEKEKENNKKWYQKLF